MKPVLYLVLFCVSSIGVANIGAAEDADGVESGDVVAPYDYQEIKGIVGKINGHLEKLNAEERENYVLHLSTLDSSQNLIDSLNLLVAYIFQLKAAYSLTHTPGLDQQEISRIVKNINRYREQTLSLSQEMRSDFPENNIVLSEIYADTVKLNGSLMAKASTLYYQALISGTCADVGAVKQKLTQCFNYMCNSKVFAGMIADQGVRNRVLLPPETNIVTEKDIESWNRFRDYLQSSENFAVVDYQEDELLRHVYKVLYLNLRHDERNEYLARLAKKEQQKRDEERRASRRQEEEYYQADLKRMGDKYSSLKEPVVLRELLLDIGELKQHKRKLERDGYDRFPFYQQVLEALSGNNEADVINLYYQYGIKKNWDLILRGIDAASTKDIDTRLLFLKALCLVKLDNTDAAKAVLTRLIDLNPDDKQAQYMLMALGE